MPQKHFKIIIFLLILSIFLIRLFYSLPNAPLLDADAISSVQAARSIIETGVPARNGVFYPRDYLAHYLLAGSIFLIGDNPLSYAVPNLIFSILVLILLYFVARILTKNKIVIFLTIFFVAISSVENTFAINPRSYMQFQFFFLLAVFCFYKGFVERNKLQNKQNKKYQILTLFSYIVSILSHLSGIILMPVFGLYLIVKNKKWYRDKLILAISIIIILFSTFLMCVKLPIDNRQVNPNKVSFNLPCDFRFQIPFLEKEPVNLTAKKWDGPSGISLNLTSNFSHLFTYLPFICLFVFAGMAKLIVDTSLSRRARECVKLASNTPLKIPLTPFYKEGTFERGIATLYFYCIFLSSLFLISLLTLHGADKYIFCIFPIFALLVFLGVADFIEFIVGKNNSKLKLVSWIIILILTFSLALPAKNIISYPNYSFHSLFNDSRAAVFYLAENKRERDIIIANDTAIYRFYLNHCDYNLRQRVIGEDNNGEPVWNALEFQNQSPAKIDSVDKLEKVLNNNQRVWLIKSKEIIGPEIVQYIKENMELKFFDYPIYIYFSGE